MTRANEHADPFEVFGLEPTFDIDPARVERGWMALAAQLHPDRAGEDAEAGERLARVNDARRVLLDPELRANALLTRLGGSSKEADRSLPEGFLVEMMEVREQAEDARASGDSLRWEAFRGWAGERRARHMARVRELFGAFTVTPNGEILSAVRTELNAWRYIERMLEQLEGSLGVR